MIARVTGLPGAAIGVGGTRATTSEHAEGLTRPAVTVAQAVDTSELDAAIEVAFVAADGATSGSVVVVVVTARCEHRERDGEAERQSVM
jgi:hypothetical protein